MNKFEKDLLFYSNYCIHSNKLINTISKTPLHNSIFYICIDDSNIKVPNFITRVPSIFLVNEKKVLVEDDIDYWISMKLGSSQKSQQVSKEEQYQDQLRQQQMEHQRQMKEQLEQQMQNQQQNNQLEMPHPQQNQPPQYQQNNQSNLSNQSNQSNLSNQNQENSIEGNNEIMAYHRNEMGSSMSDTYSFIEESGNSSMNHNFSFLDGTMPVQTNINTPKDFNENNNQVKTKLDSDFDKLLQARNEESFSKGIQRI